MRTLRALAAKTINNVGNVVNEKLRKTSALMLFYACSNTLRYDVIYISM